MNRILRGDWLPERARWRDIACWGLPAVSLRKIVFFFNMISSSLTKLGWILAGYWPRSFLRVYMDVDYVSVHNHAKKTRPISRLTLWPAP